MDLEITAEAGVELQLDVVEIVQALFLTFFLYSSFLSLFSSSL